MLLRGDFVTPVMDFTLFLNKPPLAFWGTAAAFTVFGVNEWARLVVVLAAAATIVCTARLGARLFTEATGLLAAVLLATMTGFVLEARTLRPDAIVVASVAGAVLCWLRAREVPDPLRTRWLVAMWTVLGVGTMAKGLVPLVLAGVPIGCCTLRDEGLAGLRRLRPVLGAAVLGAVVLPWHLAVAARNPGFAWDYIVNQHVLFFLDRKLPRDSTGDTLGFFWSAFLGRAFPWVLLVPLSAGEAWRGRRHDATPAERGGFCCWAWLGGVLGVFSLAPSRLEHYALPALPPAAVLAAHAVMRLHERMLGSAAWAWVGALAALLVVAGAGGLVVGRDLVAQTDWLAEEPRLLALVAPAAAGALASGLVLAAAALGRRAVGVVVAFATVGVTLAVIVVVALVEAEPLFSWKPAGELLRTRVPPAVEVVFEAPEEYQIVGGLVFYTGRRITLLEVPGFVPPPYLVPHLAGMFLARAEFERRWRSGEPLVLVSDPRLVRESPAEIVPQPHHVLGRFGDRWILSTVPAAGLS
jgi:4-amino-4-deoxy-L-arabinose transferase-like glycosyltransferase